MRKVELKFSNVDCCQTKSIDLGLTSLLNIAEVVILLGSSVLVPEPGHEAVCLGLILSPLRVPACFALEGRHARKIAEQKVNDQWTEERKVALGDGD